MWSRADSFEVNWKTLQRAENEIEYEKVATMNNKMHLEEEPFLGLNGSVESNSLRLDRNREKVGPRKEPTHTALAKTSDHLELFAELCSNVTTERKREGKSRGKISDTEDKTMSNAEKMKLIHVKVKRS